MTAGKLIINAAGDLPASHAVSITGGVLELAANTGGETLSSLSISPNGAMDIGNNHVILSDPSGSIDATIRDYLINGYNNGNWNGTGATGGSIITSSATGTKYGIGYADGANGGISGITSGQLEVKYTLYGDANLDGSVNSIDFGDMAANFGKSGKVWDQGDFNYDGAVNSIDFGLLAGNFGKSVGGNADVVTVRRLGRTRRLRRGQWSDGRGSRTGDDEFGGGRPYRRPRPTQTAKVAVKIISAMVAPCPRIWKETTHREELSGVRSKAELDIAICIFDLRFGFSRFSVSKRCQ